MKHTLTFIARRFFKRQLAIATAREIPLRFFLMGLYPDPEIPDDPTQPWLKASLLHIHDLRRWHPEREVRLKWVK